MTELKRFNLPDVGEGLTEAEILNWHVASGEQVKVNQTIVEIETAKAAVELPCPYDGVIGDLLVEEGQTVEVGTAIFTIETSQGASGETAEPSASEQGQDAKKTGDQEQQEQRGQGEQGEGAQGGGILVGYGPRARSARRRPRKERTAAGPNGVSAGGAPSSSAPGGDATVATSSFAPAEPPTAQPGGRSQPSASPRQQRSDQRAEGQQPPERVSVLAKPPVRKYAKDLGIDLRTVSPSGPGGTITRADVSAAAERATAQPTAAPTFDATREQRIPVKGVRKHTAAAMVSSAFTAPHVTEFLAVDATPTVEAVERIQRMPDYADLRVSPLLLAAKAVLVAIARNPMVNSSWDEDAQEIVVKEYVNLGIAVASARGLVVPNLKGAESMSVPQLARGIQDIVATAREGKTSPEAMQGGTLTITNVGVFGVDTGTPILNPGEAAILALGAIREQPWVHQGQVVPRQVVQLSLSFDHRIVDGELGSRFLADIGTMLADPTTMLAWS